MPDGAPFTGQALRKRLASFGQQRSAAGLEMADIVGFGQGQGDLAAARVNSR